VPNLRSAGLGQSWRLPLIGVWHALARDPQHCTLNFAFALTRAMVNHRGLVSIAGCTAVLMQTSIPIAAASERHS
jgi:hypothetical protein